MLFRSLVVLGNDEQISAFAASLEQESKKLETTSKSNITLESVLVEPNSVLCGKSILKSGLKENVRCLVVGIERDGKSMMNPHYTMVFEAGDIVWIVGDKQRLHDFLLRKNANPIVPPVKNT